MKKNIILIFIFLIIILIGSSQIQKIKAIDCHHGVENGEGTCDCPEKYRGHSQCLINQDGGYCKEISRADMPSGQTTGTGSGVIRIEQDIYTFGGENAMDQILTFDNGNIMTVSLNQGTFNELLGTQCGTYEGAGYCFGGEESGTLTNSFYKFNVTIPAWEVLTLQSEIGPRSFGGYVTIGKKLYIMGGKGLSNPLGNISTITMDTYETTAAVSMLNYPRFKAYTAKTKNNMIFVFGGLDVLNLPLNSIERLNGTTTEVLNVTGYIPSPRSYGAAMVFNNFFYITGGYNGTYLDEIYKLNIKTNMWYRKQHFSLNVPLQGHALIPLEAGYDHVLMVLGGESLLTPRDFYQMLELEECTCNTGYGGGSCDQPVCNNNCGTYGTCVGPNICECQTGYGGKYCELSIENYICRDVIEEDNFTGDIPGSRMDVNTATTIIGTILYGGRNSSLGSPLGMDGLYTANPIFKTVSSLPLDLNSEPTMPLYGATCELYKGKMICLGGRASTDTFNPHLLELDISDIIWKTYVVYGSTSSAFLSPGFIHRGSFYQIAGHSNVVVTKSVRILDLETMHMEQVIESLEVGTRDHIAVKYNESLVFIYGGYDGNHMLDTTYIYDLQRRIVDIIPVSTSPAPYTRWGSAITYKDYVWVYGLLGTMNVTDAIHKFNMKTYQWEIGQGKQPGPYFVSKTSVIRTQDPMVFYTFGGLVNVTMMSNGFQKVDLHSCQCRDYYTGENCNVTTCHYVLSNSSYVCGGHGQCHDYNQCTCDPFYSGTTCDEFACYGETIEACSSNGVCIAHNNCSCNMNYFGETCNLTTCNAIQSDQPGVCSGHGTCQDHDVCVCDALFLGSHCQDLLSCFSVAANDSAVCSGHGECQSPDTCVCASNYSGPACQIYFCYGVIESNSGVCSGHGTCNGPNNCSCNAGYYGPSCNQYYCNSHISFSNAGCHEKGLCTAPETCNCFEGYAGQYCNVTQCNLIDATNATVCGGHGTCVSGNNCSCLEGYEGDECSHFSCFGIAFNETTSCSEHGQCTASNTCTCEPGYFGDCSHYACFGTNSTDTTVCSSHGVCTQPNVCNCESNYLGQTCSNFSCFGIMDSTSCSQHGVCVAPNTCQCDNEYMISADCSVFYDPLVLDIKGGSRQTGKEVTLDASKSLTLNSSDPIESYTWTCSHPTSCPFESLNGSIQSITFNASGSYIIQLKVSLMSGHYSQSNITLDVQEEDIPDFILELDSTVYSRQQDIFIFATGKDTQSVNAQFQWFFKTNLNSVYYPLTQENIHGLTINSPNVLIKAATFKNASFVDIKCVLSSSLSGESIKQIKFLKDVAFEEVLIEPKLILKNTSITIRMKDNHCDRFACRFNVGLLRDSQKQFLIYNSPNTSITLRVPQQNTQKEVQLFVEVRDNYGLSALSIQNVTLLASQHIDSFIDQMNALNDLQAKSNLALYHLQQQATNDTEEIDLILDVLDALENTQSNSYIQSIALKHINSTQAKQRLLTTSENCMNALLNDNTNTRFEKYSETASNILETFSNTLDANTTFTNRIHSNVERLNTFVEKNLYLGEASFQTTLKNMNVSLTKVLPSSLNQTRVHEAIDLPNNVGVALNNLLQQPINNRLGLTVKVNQFAYVPFKNDTTFDSSLELTFKNGDSKLNVSKLTEPLRLRFPKIHRDVVQEGAYYNRTCTFFNETTLKWETNGCAFINNSCFCDHTTLFSIDFSLILPQFNLIDFKEHSIFNLNKDNMTVSLILGGILFGYVVLLCLFQLLDVLTHLIQKIHFKPNPILPIGYKDASGHRHYIIPIFQRIRDIHQWISVFLSPNAPDLTYSKQQRLTVLLILILGIMLSNALTVGIGADNESIYVTACIVADLITQPFALLAAFLFLKVKPREKKKLSKLTLKNSKGLKKDLKKLKYQLDVLDQNYGKEVISAEWQSIPCNLSLTKIFLLEKTSEESVLLFGACNDKLVLGTFNTLENQWKMRSTSALVLPELVSQKGQFFYIASHHAIFYVYSDTIFEQLSILTFDLEKLSWKNSKPSCTIPNYTDMALCVHQHAIYCFGGMTKDKTLTNHFAFYSPAEESWQDIVLSRMSTRPLPRTNALLTSYKNGLYLIGGDQVKDAYYFSDLNIFEFLSNSIRSYPHSFALPSQEMLLLLHITDSNELQFQNVSEGCAISHSLVNDDPLMLDYFERYGSCFYSSELGQIGYLKSIHLLDKSKHDDLYQKLELEAFVAKETTSRLVRDLGVTLFDKLLGSLAKLFSSIDIKKFGVLIILLATLVYFIILAGGCYIMVYVNWLGPIGTTTYGVMGLLSYMTLIIQLYIQSKRKIYIEEDIPYRSRLTYVASILCVVASIITLFLGAGTIYGLTYIENITDRVGIMLIMSIFFIGLICNFLRLALNLVWAPARSKNKFLSLLERPWFPNWFKYPIFLFCFVEIGVMCWFLVMYSIKFHKENMTPDWLIACGFGNSQNFLLDQTLVFITTTFVMTTVLQFFEALIRPRHHNKVVVLDDPESDSSGLSSHQELISHPQDDQAEFHPISL